MSYADSQMYSTTSAPFQLKQYSEAYSTNLYPPFSPDGKYTAHPDMQQPQPAPQNGPVARYSGLHGDGFHLQEQEYSLRSHSQPIHASYQPPPSFQHNLQASVPSQVREAPNGWQHSFDNLGNRGPHNIATTYTSLPSPSPYPAPRLSPPLPNQLNGGPQQHNNSRMPLAGSFDPSTGIFYRTPEHPRLRTAQACEKCRTRKAKCSGEHPSCKRCINRGLLCEYAKEGRVRGPNKTKSRSGTLSDDSRIASRGRTTSSNNTTDIEQHDFSDVKDMQVHDRRMSLPTELAPRRLSLGENRTERLRPPDLRVEVSSNHYRLEGPQSSGPDIGSGAYCQPPAESIPGNSHLGDGHGFSIDSNSCQAASISAYYGQINSSVRMEERPPMDDSRSNSSASSGGLPGNCRVPPPLLTVGPSSYLRHQDDVRSHSDAGSLSNPQSAVSLTFNSSPTSVMGSPITPASSLAQYSRENECVDTLHPGLDSQRIQPSGMHMEPVWVNMHGNSELEGHFRSQGKHDSRTNMAVHDSQNTRGDPMALRYPLDLEMH